MPFAARVLDNHKCLQTNPNGSPHTGGPILPPGVPTVLIGGMPAAVAGAAGSLCFCASPLPDKIIKGSSTVKIGGQPAAYQGENVTQHGGSILTGCTTVIIGI